MFFYEVICYCETKQFWKKVVLPPPPLPVLSLTFFVTRTFLKHWRVPLQFSFGTLRQETIDRKSCYPLAFLSISFSIPDFFETQNGFSSKCFDTVRQNKIDGKSWYPPPLLSLTFFDTRSFLIQRRVHLHFFWYREKKNRQKIVIYDIPLLLECNSDWT